MNVCPQKVRATDDLGGATLPKTARRDALWKVSSSPVPTYRSIESVSLLVSSLSESRNPRPSASRSGRRPSARSCSRRPPSTSSRSPIVSSSSGGRKKGTHSSSPQPTASQPTTASGRRSRFARRAGVPGSRAGDRARRAPGGGRGIRLRWRCGAGRWRYRTLHYASAMCQPPQTTLLSVSLRGHLLPPNLGWSA